MFLCALLVFACAMTTPLHVTAEGTAAAAKAALLKSLLTDRFASYVAPQVDQKSPVHVAMSNMSLDFDFSSTSRKLVIESPLILRWKDPRLVWDPSKYWNLQQLTDVDSWRPDIQYGPSTSGYKLTCDKIRVRYTGDVECLSHLHFEIICVPHSLSFFTPDEFNCYYGLNWWARINVTCDHAPLAECLNISQLSPHALYHVKQHSYGHGIFKHWKVGSVYYTQYDMTLTQRSSAKATFLLPILVLGGLVLLLSLLVMNFRERVFLHVLFTEAALVLLYSLEGVPGVLQGEAPLFLRACGAVLLLNSGLMALNVALVAATTRPGPSSQAVASQLVAWVDRLRLSFLWPSSSRVAEQEGEWARLCVVFDRLIFLVSAAVLAVVAFAP